MRRAALAALLALCTGACGYTGGGMDNSGGALSMTTVEEITVAGDYQAVASCAFARFYKWAGAGLNKIDLPPQKSSQISQESGGVRYWQVDLRETSKGQTHAKLAVVQTMWGPSRAGAEAVISDIKACSSPIR